MVNLVAHTREVYPEIVRDLQDKYKVSLSNLRFELAKKYEVDISEFDEDVVDDYIIGKTKEHHFILNGDIIAITYVLFSEKHKFMKVNPPSPFDLSYRMGHKDIFKTPETVFKNNPSYWMLKVTITDYLIKELRNNK